MAIDPKDFGASFKGFMDQMSTATPSEEPFFRELLREHFGESPDKLHTLAEKVPPRDHANVQLAIESVLLKDNEVREYGFTIGHQFLTPSLAMLAAQSKGGMMGGSQFDEGPIEYINIPIGNDRVMPCIKNGLFVTQWDGEPLALLVAGPAREFHPMAMVTLDVMASRQEVADSLLRELRNAMRKQNVFRGQVISLVEARGVPEVKFHSLPDVSRDNIILPQGLLDRVERQTVRFSQLADQLRASGRHLKRGILLHGPPGTGKTLTAMYVAKAIKDRTVLVLTGQGQAMIEQSCAMARALQPAIVILEDVDLIAEERTQPGQGCSSPLLFELLNQMDGLGDDADVLFLLTTNRPDILEPALAARPGRIDQAIEVPLPDAECRRRLLQLYSEGLRIGEVDLEQIVQRTGGASAAFIRELMRKAALFAADEASETVENSHFDTALHELVVDGGALTQKLLGFAKDT